MNGFGQTLFGGSRFIRWTLTPFVLLFAILMPLCLEDLTLAGTVMMVGLELMCLSILAGFWLPAQLGHWSFRALAGLVFIAYLSYLIHEFFFTGKAFSISAGRSGSSPFGALLGFVIIGLPSLMFAILGRFSLREEPTVLQLAAERHAYEEVILQPDWRFYEHHLQRSIPSGLRELYADRQLVVDGGFSYDAKIAISTFEPLSEQSLLDTREQLGVDVVAFATSDYGDPIYLRPGTTEPDKVYLTFHDGDETIVIADSVDAFLKQLRTARPADRRDGNN